MPNRNTSFNRTSPLQKVQERAQRTADAMGYELVDVTLQKESRGKCLCVYVDLPGGISLDDCEKYHKTLQPLLEDIDYDIMEVSSPGVDRPIKTMRDFERSRGLVVEVHLFAAQDGVKNFTGTLDDFTEEAVTITDALGVAHTFERKAVSLIKPVVDLDDEDLADISFDEQ